MEEAPQETIDLSHKSLKKLNKCTNFESQIVINLILDNNELQRLDNIDSYLKLQKLSAVHNQILRMYGVCRLHSLNTLNLAYNRILTIEGVKELVNLKYLCLSGNSIKTIEHLTNNICLEYLDLSENNITHIGDLSLLKNLKELHLHHNKINYLRQADKFLPVSLTNLTLANNNIEDLNEISQLVHLNNLTNISIANNPCVHTKLGFDYRPFVINWCLSVKTIDGYVVDAIESLRAEWLYSQGRGRHFRVGDQKELINYLIGVCPLIGKTLETEEDRKLRLILSKAQHHQQQLREQSLESRESSPSTRKKIYTGKNPSRIASRIGSGKSPDRMSLSCHSNTSEIEQVNMSKSLDASILRDTILKTEDEPSNSPLQALSKMMPVPESLMSPDCQPVSSTNSILNLNNKNQSPKSVTKKLQAKNLSLVGTTDEKNRKCNTPSPARRVRPEKTIIKQKPVVSNNKGAPSILRKSESSDDESEMYASKLRQIQLRAEEKRVQKEDTNENDNKIEQAAIYIQKIWRGYLARNRNKEVQQIFKTLQRQRSNSYIQQLTCDMATTKAALESERKIQMLQTEAINALWKQMSIVQPNNGQSTLSTAENAEVIKELATTCSALQSQIQQLQKSMQDIVKVMTVFSKAAAMAPPAFIDGGIATQTDIVAVHTPQDDGLKEFPFQKQSRPSSLPLPINQRKKDSILNTELQQFAGDLVDDVIKTVSEPKPDYDDRQTTKITVTNLDR